MVQDNTKFNFFIPAEIVKGGKNGHEMYIKGIASSEVEDSDGETLVPAGYDLKPLLTSGFLNYNHQANKDPNAIIGEPTKAEIVNKGKDLYIEGFFYPDSELARKTYQLAEVLEKNSPNKRMGFSIEGKALERDPFNPKRITKAKITGVAITPCPKNPNTLMSIVKGEYAEPFIDNEEDEEVDKAMTAASGEGVWQKESVEGGQKTLDALTAVKTKEEKKLKKSEVYSLIFTRYSDYMKEDIQKAKQIYQLVQDFNNKLYSMEHTNDNILSKALNEAFSFIDERIETIKKGEEMPAAAEEVEEVAKSENASEVAKVEEKKEDPKEEEIEKAEGGPGSRGGNVVGYTTSGSPIYDTEYRAGYKDEHDSEAKNHKHNDATKSPKDKKEHQDKKQEKKTVKEYNPETKKWSEKKIKKSEEDETSNSNNMNELEKSEGTFGMDAFLKSFIKEELQKGRSEEEIVEDMVSKGCDSAFVTTLMKSVVDEMSDLEANGALSEEGIAPVQESTPTSTHSPRSATLPISKSEDLDLLKSEISQELSANFESTQRALIESLDSRFVALGNIIKSQQSDLNTYKEGITGLKAENTNLKKSLAELQNQLSNFSAQPQRARSITTAAQVVERFPGNNIQKSENGSTVLSLSKASDMKVLTDELNAEYDIRKSRGTNDKALGDALFELSVAGVLDPRTVGNIQGVLSARNITLVQ